MTRKSQRILLFVVAAALLGTAAALTLSALRNTLVFFLSPTEVLNHPPTPERPFRLGGLVEPGSVARDGGTTRFTVTDMNASIPVVFTGLLPDLFREGQGVVAEGAIGLDGVFAASSVLAKHDETYMPPEVADALKKSGAWTKEQTEAVRGETIRGNEK